MYICAPFVCLVLKKAREAIGSFGLELQKSLELLRGYWELNQGPLEEEQVLLTSEPSLQYPQPPPSPRFKNGSRQATCPVPKDPTVTLLKYI